MRAVKRKSKPLNTQKQKALQDLGQAYTREKKFWLCYFQSFKSQAYLARPRSLRDELIKQNYRSPNGLQARHWKLALDEAAEIWDKYWEATFVKVRPKIARQKNLSEEERHYAYWLLKGYPQFTAMMQRQSPEPPFSIEVSLQKIAALVRRLVKKCRGKAPSLKKARSVQFDANCYDCFEHNGTQYIKLMSLVPGKRIVVPLSGKTAISGTIKLILIDGGIELHVPQELKKRAVSNSAIEAVDFGYTEVMTDTQGIRYGTQFGKELTKITEQQHRKMQKRHKLHALEKKAGNANIRKYNLGKKKQNATKEKTKATLKKEINTGINQLIRTKKPAILITEDLRHTRGVAGLARITATHFLTSNARSDLEVYGSTSGCRAARRALSYDKPKRINRRLSNWLKGELQDRVSFKALAEGFRHEQVNPAYGSQSCPYCEFVDKENRVADRFQCLHCGHEDQSDRVAALNYARRYGDPEIGRYTPYREVKTILLARFHRRLEAEVTATVPGRTLETVEEMYPPSFRDKVIASREKSRKNWTVNQRAKQKLNTF